MLVVTFLQKTPDSLTPTVRGLVTLGRNEAGHARFVSTQSRNVRIDELLELGRRCSAVVQLQIARVAYQEFLTIWKDADLPVVKEAKSELAKL